MLTQKALRGRERGRSAQTPSFYITVFCGNFEAAFREKS